MSATSLSRRSGIRAPSGAARGSSKINPNALPRPTQTSIFDNNTEYGSSVEHSTASTASGQQVTNEEKEAIRTRLFDDSFTREYRPSYYSASAPSIINIGTNSDSGGAAIVGVIDTLSPRIERQRPNTLHQDSLVAGKDIYEYHDHEFPAPPRTSNHIAIQQQEQWQQQLQQQQQYVTPPQQLPRPFLQNQQLLARWVHGNMNRALSRSKIPPRSDSMESSYDNANRPALNAPEPYQTNDAEGVQLPIEYLDLVEESGEEEEDDEEEEELLIDYSDDDSQGSGDYNQGNVQKFQLQDTQIYYSNQGMQAKNQAPIVRSRSPALHSDPPMSTGPVKHYTPEIETQETLKRERTRILQRTVVSSYRQINYKDITNIQPLKKGGFGEIHTAEWSHLKVVLKRAIEGRGEGVEQFDQELEILKRVHDYDFIVPFYGVTTDPISKVRCMVMKHCINGNLCSFLEKYHTTLSWGERYRLSIEITKGLEFLHKSGFHHRDLHSGNILLDDKRTAMICDFGLSRSSNKTRSSDLVAAVGVASFLAPERFPTKRPIYSAACDIYSLGVIFWHISSGRIPFAKRLRDPTLLSELMDGRREEIVPGTPREFRDMIVKCWDVNPARRLKIDVVIAILQTLMAKPSEPIHQAHQGLTGFTVPSNTVSAALPVPPELDTKMASLERASNTLNRMVFDIKYPAMRDTVNYIERARAFFREQRMPAEPYSPTNPPKAPIYFCPLVGDIAGFNYYLSQSRPYNPINESSEQTGDTALHLACLFLESPLDTIKVLVELGADINLENLQGYTPVMILVSSNTQYCYEALKYFVMRGARIPAYIRKPITPMNNAQIYALNLVNESRRGYPSGNEDNEYRWPRNGTGAQNQDRSGRRIDRFYAQGRPLIHVAAAMQDDYRILDCLCEAGLDPAISFGGETALVAAAAHLKIKNIEWLLNNDLDISAKAQVARAIKVVRMLHVSVPTSPTEPGRSGGSPNPSKLNPKEFPDDVRDLGKYSWAGVAYRDSERYSKDMIGPVLQLLEQWTGSRRITARKDVATKLKLMHGATVQTDATNQPGAISPVAVAASVHNNNVNMPYIPPPPPSVGRISSSNGPASRQLSLRKNQRHLIDQVLNDKSPAKFW